MATGSIESIQKLLNSNEKEQCRELYYQWSEDIKESNLLIEQIKTNSTYISENIKMIASMIEKLNQELDYYAELGIDLETSRYDSYGFLEIRRNLEKNYRTLSLEYYKYNFQKFEDISKKEAVILRKMNNVDNKIESLGATFLNIVLTISIVSTMVTVLLNTSAKYSLAIILCCAWLLLSSIIFVGSYFKREKPKKAKGLNITFEKIIYIILSIVTLCAFLFGVFSDCDSNKKKDDKENIDANIYIK